MGSRHVAAGPAGSLVYTRSGAGPPVVLVHGWCCDRSFLEPQRTHLAASRTVLALDLRGHGESDRAGDSAYAVGDLADDVAAVAADAGVESPVVIGHSLGGLVALECAARGFASAAVLLEPAPLLDAPGKDYFLRSAPQVAQDAKGSWRRRFAERIMLPTDRVRRDEILDRMPLTDPHIAAAAMRGMGEYDAAEALGRVGVPVLVVSGARGEDLRPVQALCRHVVTGQTVGAGHFNHLEVPAQVNPMIDRFLQLAGV